MSRQTPASISSDSHVHKLEGRPLRQWWQIDDLFALKRKSFEQDKFQNQALRSHVAFFATLPFVAGLILYTAGMAYAPVILLPLLLLLTPLVLHFIDAYRRHARRVLEVQNLSNQLILKSPGLEKRIMLAEVREFFPVSSGDYILEINNGEYFVLSRELTKSDQLFAHLSQSLHGKAAASGGNYLLPGYMTDSMEMACLAIIVAVLSPYAFRLVAILFGLKQAAGATAFGSTELTGLFLSLVFVGLCLVFRNAVLSRFAELVRLSEYSCAVRTRRGYSSIPVESIKSVRRIFGHTLVSHNNGWFITISDKGESTNEKLMSLNQTNLCRLR